jgi:hypothetical protein
MEWLPLNRETVSLTFLFITIILIILFLGPFFVQTALQVGLFPAWVYMMLVFLPVSVGFMFAFGKGVKRGVEAWLVCVGATSFMFLGFIVVLPTAYQILVLTIVAAALISGFYAFKKYAHNYVKRQQVKKKTRIE